MLLFLPVKRSSVSNGNAALLELANWTIVITSVPAQMLTFEQALALLRARWQIKIALQIVETTCLLDEWNATNPWRILCEVYAKLLAMLVQHWFVLHTSWDDPHHSLSSRASVLLRLPQTGPVLLTIDAVPVQKSFIPEREAGPLDEDEEALRASTRKLLDVVRREQVSLIIFGHDAEQWQTLKKAPDCYG